MAIRISAKSRKASGRAADKSGVVGPWAAKLRATSLFEWGSQFTAAVQKTLYGQLFNTLLDWSRLIQKELAWKRRKPRHLGTMCPSAIPRASPVSPQLEAAEHRPALPGSSRDMPRRNRVTPSGEIVAMPERGTMMGNRGIRGMKSYRSSRHRRPCVRSGRDTCPTSIPRRWRREVSANWPHLKNVEHHF